MRLDALAKYATRHRTTVVLSSLLTTFAGVALILDRPKGSILEWLSIPLVVCGGGLFAWALWPSGNRPPERAPNLASRLILWLTPGGRLQKLFPVLGVGIVIADLSYNLLLSATPAIQTEDTIVLLGAFTLMAYGFVPAKFGRERDFVLVFFIALNAILVIPLLVARAYYADFERSVDVYSWVALAPQAGAVLSVFGVANSVHAVSGYSAPGLTFTPKNLSIPVTVVITTACSGIYSFGIFASAFMAFVLTEYERFSRRVWILLGLGFLTSYVANVLRMVVIVLVGYYTDTAQTDLENLLTAHSYAGWLIFLGWITLFWGVVFKWMPDMKREVPETEDRHHPQGGTVCGICNGVLTPVLPATRCACGCYYHRDCLESEGRCSSCGIARSTAVSHNA